jgi:microcystin degradation protein MlrC
MRIAFVRFMQETNSFSPVPTTLNDFRHFIEGEELLTACQPGNWEIEGYLRNLELTGFSKAV